MMEPKTYNPFKNVGSLEFDIEINYVLNTKLEFYIARKIYVIYYVYIE